jgi:hypothetical protein
MEKIMSKNKNVILRRVDKNVWGKLSSLTPGMTDSERSRALWSFSLFNIEAGLRTWRDNNVFGINKKQKR